MKDHEIREPLEMKPYFSERPWGGTRLAEKLGKPLPAGGGPYGEAWELSDHPNGRSTVATGYWAGRTFGDLTREFPRKLCGMDAAPERYPLLVKYIDAARDLSIQVHPSDATAPAGDRGKTECWYVMDCEPGAEIIHGLTPGVDAAGLRAAAESGAMEETVRRVPVAPGTFVSIPAGTVHALLGGTMICEVQQSSDTTYRLWDWNRQPARPLHIAESCAVATYGGGETPPVDTTRLAMGELHELARNAYFRVRLLAVGGGRRTVADVEHPHGMIVNVVAGAGAMVVEGKRVELRLGATWFLPAGLALEEVKAGPAGVRVLLSESME